MPINAEIPLQVKAPQFDTAGIVNQIQHGRQMQMEQQRLQMQQTAANEQTQLHNLTIQDHQREVDDESNKTRAYNDAGGDLDKFLTLAGQYGVSAKGLQGIQKGILDHREQVGKLTETEQGNAKRTAEAIGNSAQGLLSMPDEGTRAASWGGVRAQMIQQGHGKPEEIPEQYPGQQWLTDHRNGAVTAIQQLDETRKDAEAQRQQGEFDIKAQEAQLKQEAAAREKLSRENPGDSALAAAALDAKGRLEEAHRKITEAETAKQHENTNRNERARIGLEGARVGLERQRFNATLGAGLDANGQPLPPEQALARAQANPTAMAGVKGDIDPATLRALIRKTPALIGQMKTIDPSWDEATMERRYGTLKEFNSTSNSKAGGQVIALNTLIHHADLYLEAADALKNGSFVPGNAVYNKVATMFGAAPPTNAKLLARFFAGETGKVATGGVPAEGEINGILGNMSTDGSPEAMKGAAMTMMRIAGGRATPLMERIKESKLENVVKVLGPDAQEILKRRGFNPDTMKPAEAGGANGRKPLSEIFK